MWAEPTVVVTTWEPGADPREPVQLWLSPMEPGEVSQGVQMSPRATLHLAGLLVRASVAGALRRDDTFPLPAGPAGTVLGRARARVVQWAAVQVEKATPGWR